MQFLVKREYVQQNIITNISVKKRWMIFLFLFLRYDYDWY